MDFLTFDLTEVDDGVSSLEAMASTAVERHTAVMAEVQQVLDWRGVGTRHPMDPWMTGWTGTTTFRCPSRTADGTRSR